MLYVYCLDYKITNWFQRCCSQNYFLWFNILYHCDYYWPEHSVWNHCGHILWTKRWEGTLCHCVSLLFKYNCLIQWRIKEDIKGYCFICNLPSYEFERRAKVHIFFALQSNTLCIIVGIICVTIVGIYNSIVSL